MAIAGAATYAGGNIANAYGENQGLKAMQGVWDDAQRRNAGYDAQLQQSARDLVAGSGIDANRNAAGAQQLRQQLDEATLNTAKGAMAQANRRPGSNTPRMNAGYQSALADALRRAGPLARLQAMQQGAGNVDLLGRTFASNRGDIANRSREWAALVPLLQAAAGARGGDFRAAGKAGMAVGQGMMSYGMSQPAQGDTSGGIFSDLGSTDARGSIYTDPYTGLRTAQT